VVEQLPAGLVIAEPPTGRVLIANSQASAIFRLPRIRAGGLDDYAVGLGFDTQSGKPYEARDWPLARTIMTGETVIDEEIDILRSDDTRGRILVRSAPVLDSGGRVEAAVATFFDITERTRAERGERFLATASAALNDCLDFQGTLDRIGHLTVPELADWCVIQTLPDLEEARGVTATHARPEDLQRAQALLRELDPPPALTALLERALCSERPELVRDLSHPALASLDEHGAFRRFVQALGISSAMVVPMVARGRTFGCITLATTGSAAGRQDSRCRGGVDDRARRSQESSGRREHGSREDARAAGRPGPSARSQRGEAALTAGGGRGRPRAEPAVGRARGHSPR
jgi:hypothetical protein